MNISVIGAGAWGTTLSILLSKKNYQIKLWSFEDVFINHENTKFLPGFKISSNVFLTLSDDDAVSDAEIIVFAVPSKHFRSISKRFSSKIKKNTVLVSATKGIEQGTFKRMSEILSEEMKTDKIAVISGPNLSKEIATGLPAATVVASKDETIARQIQNILMNESFRVYVNDDVIGTELGGALKNIIAIAAGAVDGLGLGDNAKAALMIRGITEIKRLGAAMGAREETFLGLSGMGDLIVTCASSLSRNHRVGMEIAKGKKLSEILSSMVEVSEGVETAKAAYELSKKHKIEMPIIEQVYEVLYKNKNPKQAIFDLMNRSAKAEIF